jgi:four helix bundle protein
MRSFRGLEVWQRAHRLTMQAYRETERFPRSERYGLASQVRRASAAIPTKIAEGCGRSQQEFAHFLQIAMGSATELEYELFLSAELGYLEPAVHSTLEGDVVAVRQMLSRLASAARQSPRPRAKRAAGSG